MKIAVLKKSAGRGDLPASVAVSRPLSQPACTTRSLTLADTPTADMGVWESSVGSFMRQLANAEMMHILAGSCTFTPEGGEPLALEAGDTVYFPPNTSGRWDVAETLRKVYVVFSPD